jgi:hypothetical protein
MGATIKSVLIVALLAPIWMQIVGVVIRLFASIARQDFHLIRLACVQLVRH